MYVFEQNIWEVVSYIRRHAKNAKIIAGGPYISKQAEEREPEYLKPLFKYLNADFYCFSREGEQTLTQLIDALKNKTDLASIPNLAYRQGRDFMLTKHVNEHNPLSSNLVDYSLFADEYRKSGWANVRVSDGCPYACAFCAFPEHGNERYITISLQGIERELDAIHEAGAITHIFFIDATLNVPKKQFRDMLRLMIDKQYGFKWHCFFRCDQTDEETIALMKQAGCVGVFLGLNLQMRQSSKIWTRRLTRQIFWTNDAVVQEIRYSANDLWFRSVSPVGAFKSAQESFIFIEEIQPDFTESRCGSATRPRQSGADGTNSSSKARVMDGLIIRWRRKPPSSSLLYSFLALQNAAWGSGARVQLGLFLCS